MKRAPALLLLALLTQNAWAEDRDADALRLADETPQNAQRASDWRSFLEAAVGAARQRFGGGTVDERRVSLDLLFDHSLAPGWRLVFADRLDASWPAQGGPDNAVNTVKETYVSTQLAPDTLADFGRINVRHGVAMGYNPTDYFRVGALRSRVAIDPASLKENRQGSVMLRGQHLWSGGALSVLVSPKLSRQPSDDAWSLDWGATNDRNRALLALSPKLAETLSLQMLLQGEETRPPQLGLNLSALINDRTTGYVEWSGGRNATQLDDALQRSAPRRWQHRLAAGATYTTPDKLSLTAEMQYDGAALARGDWDALRAGPATVYGLYRNAVQQAQELPTRRALFLYAIWQDALLQRLDLTAMMNADLIDASRRYWLEAGYRGEYCDYALQWQHSGGPPLSNYGALPQASQWQLALRYYF